MNFESKIIDILQKTYNKNKVLSISKVYSINKSIIICNCVLIYLQKKDKNNSYQKNKAILSTTYN